MDRMFIARDTSHLEMSELKDFAPEKISDMSVIADTSHSPIGPVGPFEQSPTSWTAVRSSALDCGANTADICGTDESQSCVPGSDICGTMTGCEV